jgi:hypothetical protein
MSGDVHVRFRERLGVQFPRATRLVVGFQHAEDARRFQADLCARLGQFGLTVHPDKTRLLEFGRFAAENRRKRGLGKPETFNFLGYVFAKLMWWKALGRPPECRGPLLSAT